GPRNVAVTSVASDSVTRQAPVPEQAPPQPTKCVPALRDAAISTTVFTRYNTVQVWLGVIRLSQLNIGPPSVAIAIRLPPPPSRPISLSVRGCGPRNVAVTAAASVTVT